MRATVFVILFCSNVFANVNKEVVDLNNQAVKLLQEQKFQQANEKLIKALEKSPFSPEVQFNLALSFDGMGDIEKAKKIYESLLQLPSLNSQEKFILNFNLAELYGRDKKIDEALSYYQLALKENPTSMETKTNIELLIQQQQEGSQGDQQKEQDKKQEQEKSKKGQGEDKDKDKQEKKEENKGGESEKDNKNYEKNKPQPKKFESKEISPGDVKKILEELDRQEQRVRAEYNKKQTKEKANEKDW